MSMQCLLSDRTATPGARVTVAPAVPAAPGPRRSSELERCGLRAGRRAGRRRHVDAELGRGGRARGRAATCLVLDAAVDGARSLGPHDGPAAARTSNRSLDSAGAHRRPDRPPPVARWPARSRIGAEPDDGYVRLTVGGARTRTRSEARRQGRRDPALADRRPPAARGRRRRSFVSLLDPPDAARGGRGALPTSTAAGPCSPGTPGRRTWCWARRSSCTTTRRSPSESAGALFDSTEIDEILTLRVMTMTDEEKAEARATDPRAAEIIDRCDAMSPETCSSCTAHSADPHRRRRRTSSRRSTTGDVPWWDPAADASVSAGGRQRARSTGCRVAKGSLVRVHPSRRADAQDLFFADQVAGSRPCSRDVDGEHPRRARARRRPGGRPARLVRPLPVLRPGRARTTGSSTRGEPVMRVIGMATTVVVAAVACHRRGRRDSFDPDIKRYLKIRQM